MTLPCWIVTVCAVAGLLACIIGELLNLRRSRRRRLNNDAYRSSLEEFYREWERKQAETGDDDA